MTSSTSSWQVRAVHAVSGRQIGLEQRAHRDRARCSNTRWLTSVRSSRSSTSWADKPSTSRRVITLRCESGRRSIASSSLARVSPASSTSSGRSLQVCEPRPPVSGPVGVVGRQEAIGVDRRPVVGRQRRKRRRPALALGACDRAVGEDPKHPGLERRAPLEPVEALQDGQPRLLGDLLGHRLIAHVRLGDAHERRLVAIDQLAKRLLVAAPQGRDHAGVVRG